MATLRSFLQRSAALRLYRDVLRTSRLAPPHVRKSIRDEARREFKAAEEHNLSPDSTQIDFLVSKGQNRLEELRKMLSLTR